MEYYLTQGSIIQKHGVDFCWKGFKIAKSDGDTKKMEYYAKGIRKFQRELKISVSDSRPSDAPPLLPSSAWIFTARNIENPSYSLAMCA
jgi:hypothetical protein